MELFANNRTKIENALFTCVALIFGVSIVVNVPYVFSPSGGATLFGAICSYAYIVLWCVTTCILRKRTDWIWTTFVVRTITVIVFFTTIGLTHFDLDIKYMIFSAIAYIPFGMLFPVYGGLSSAILNSRWFFAIPIGQAIISIILFARMRLCKSD